MKTLQFIALIMLSYCITYGQTTIKISIIKSEKYLIDKVDIFDISQRESFEIPYNNIVSFSFKKPGPNCYNIRYHSGEKIFRQQIWLDTGKLEMQVHIDSSKLIIDTVLNSPLYYETLEFQKYYSDLFQKKDTVKMNKTLLDLYKKNIETPYSFVFSDLYLRLNQNNKEELEKLKTLSDRQADRFKWFIFYPIVTERLNNIFKVNSLKLKDFNFLNRNGQTKKIKSSSSRFYIFDFWFLGCAPCRREHKEIFKLQNYLQSIKAEMISVSTDTDLNKWKAYLKSNKYHWQNFLEIGDIKLTDKLKINAFPYYVILDNKENIVSTHNTFEAVINWLKKE